MVSDYKKGALRYVCMGWWGGGEGEGGLVSLCGCGYLDEPFCVLQVLEVGEDRHQAPEEVRVVMQHLSCARDTATHETPPECVIRGARVCG